MLRQLAQNGKVANDDQHGVFGRVCPFVQAANIGCRGIFQHVQRPDREPGREPCAGGGELVFILSCALCVIATVAPFGQHHAPFAVDCLLVDRQLARGLAGVAGCACVFFERDSKILVHEYMYAGAGVMPNDGTGKCIKSRSRSTRL